MDEQEESASSSQRAGPIGGSYSSGSVNSPTKSFKTPTTTPIRPQSRTLVLSPETGRRVPVIDLTDGM
jgi:hypothetical protein